MALPTLFTPSAGDQSLAYLYGIFGTVGGVITSPSGGKAATMITLMGSLFAKFNTIILAVAVLIVVYTTIVGIMNTAHEGQFMGKNWNNLWVPIRTVMGIALLVPTGSGYCGIQIIMMWVIVQGIGAADQLWSTALHYYATFGSVYAKVGVPTLEVKSSVRGLFQGLICAKSAAATYANPVVGNDDIKYYCTKNPGDTFCKNAANPETFSPSFSNAGQTSYSLGPSGACGTLTYCNLAGLCAMGYDSLACKTCQISRKALKDNIPLLADIADRYVALDHEYMVYWSQAREALKDPPEERKKVTPPKFVQEYCDANGDPECKDLPSPTGDDMSAPGNVIEKLYWAYGLEQIVGKKEGQDNFIDIMVADYSGQMDQAVLDYILNLNAKSYGGLPPSLMILEISGWIFAGMSYFKISKGNFSIVAALMPKTSFNVNTGLIPIGKRPLVGYRNNFQAAQNLACLAQGGTDCGSIASGVMSGPANGARDAISMYETGLMSYETDPLAQLMAKGETYFTIVEVIFWLFFALTIVIAIVAMIASLSVIGTGLNVGAMPILFEILMVFTPIVAALISALLSLGSIYAIYVPLIPFTIFTLGAIGWLISTVEAMVAGPLVALGIISPGGQHEVLGKAEPALGLLFGIFLRPSLMIFGMFAGMLLSAQVMKLGNLGFSMIKSDTTIGGAGMFKMFTVMFANASFIVAILNKTFSVIYVIPERVLSWIGVQMPHEGAQELAEVKGGVEKGASAAEGVGKGAQASAEGPNKVAGAADRVGANKMQDKRDKKAGIHEDKT